MAASWYKLYISTFDFVDDSKNEVELRFVWEGLDGTERDFTDKFEIYTRYHVVNNKGERRIDREDPSTTITPIPGQTEYVYYWDVPDRCVEVEMKVVAYSKTYNSNGNQVPHWDIGLTKEVTTGTDEGIVHWLYCGESHKPDKADTPTVTQNPRLGTQVALELSDIRETEGNNKDITKVEFQVLSFENDADTGSIVAGVHEAIVTDLNNCRYVVSIGTSYGYKFRARYWAGKAGESSKITGDPWAANASPIVDIAGEWSDLTDMVYGVPNVPSISEMKKQNRTQLYMKFDCEGYWHHLQMQIASTRSAFDKMDTWEIEHPDAIEDQDARGTEILVPPPLIAEINIPAHTIEYLYDYPTTQGGRLFYRVRAVSAESGAFYSGWSAVQEFQFLEGLKKPMVWMNTPYATVGDNYITLNFMHNSPTGTQTTGAQIMYRVNSGTLKPYPPTGIIDPPSNSNVYQLAFPLTDFTEECVINWQVRTAEFGEAGQDERHWSEFSDDLQFWVYEKPEIEITFPDIPENEWMPANVENDSSTIPVVSGFPLHFLITPTLGGEQAVTSYLIRIISLEAYGEYDGYGNKKFVNAGEVLYSTYDNTSKGAVDKYLNVTDCTLSNGKRYELSVIAYINTGVVAKTEAMFTVNIPQPDYVIEASVAENADAVSMLINPRAVKYEATGLNTPEHWEHNTIVAQLLQYGYYLWYDGVYQRYSDGTFNYKYNTETNFWENEILNNTSQFWGSAFWDDGLDAMYCNASKWNYETQEFESVNWTNLPQGSSFSTKRIWHGVDGKVYYTYNSYKYVLEPGTTTWSSVSWTGGGNITDGAYIWDDGVNNYYSNGTRQYVLSSDMTRWTAVSWSNIPSTFRGDYIWKMMGHIYYSYNATQLELVNGAWVNKTWNGISTLRGSGIGIIHYGRGYYDMKYTYCDGNKQYVLDESTDTWEVVAEYQKGVPCTINGYYTWHCDDDIYSSYNANYYKYDKENNRWDRMEYDLIISAINGDIYGEDVWYQGDHIYYSSESESGQYEYIKDRGIWDDKTWYQLTSFDGKNVWYVGDHVYYSSGTEHFELNVETDTWYPKTWQGLDDYYGQYIWYHNGHIYYSYGDTEYELNVDTDTWEVKTWTGIYTYRMLGTMIWSDGKDYYHSYNNDTYKLISESAWQLLDWEDGISNGSCVWFDGENAHYTIDEKDYIFYPGIESESDLVRTYPNNIALSVYRKNQDGTMVAIAENLPNADSVYITDPHPHLMKNSYRIVGRNINSGMMSFADTPEYAMHCTDIVIQWDENIHFTDVTANDLPSEYSGNILRLPYNIDVSETAGIENNMVKYIGRKDPVSYYGTQTGYTASWNTVIPKSDRETIALLRKLQVWPGDCYVREPSGTGYWANVKVTFPINHVELTVSVSISITRVEGGM